MAWRVERRERRQESESLFESVSPSRSPARNSTSEAREQSALTSTVDEKDLHRLLDGIERLKTQHAESEQQYEDDLTAARTAKIGGSNVFFMYQSVFTMVYINLSKNPHMHI